MPFFYPLPLYCDWHSLGLSCSSSCPKAPLLCTWHDCWTQDTKGCTLTPIICECMHNRVCRKHILFFSHRMWKDWCILLWLWKLFALHPLFHVWSVPFLLLPPSLPRGRRPPAAQTAFINQPSFPWNSFAILLVKTELVTANMWICNFIWQVLMYLLNPITLLSLYYFV